MNNYDGNWDWEWGGRSSGIHWSSSQLGPALPAPASWIQLLCPAACVGPAATRKPSGVSSRPTLPLLFASRRYWARREGGREGRVRCKWANEGCLRAKPCLCHVPWATGHSALRVAQCRAVPRSLELGRGPREPFPGRGVLAMPGRQCLLCRSTIHSIPFDTFHIPGAVASEPSPHQACPAMAAGRTAPPPHASRPAWGSA